FNVRRSCMTKDSIEEKKNVASLVIGVFFVLAMGSKRDSDSKLDCVGLSEVTRPEAKVIIVALPNIKAENIVFAEVNNDIDYVNVIVPPHINATTFKIDSNIYTILKVEGSYFINMIYAPITTILEKITKQNHTWHVGDHDAGVTIGASSISHLVKENQERDQMITTITTNIALYEEIVRK
ncbi:hypothetical protein HAX54_030136, partial [Datura stramonium]|nr:hypothetical protein [Datura stramonium]